MGAHSFVRSGENNESRSVFGLSGENGKWLATYHVGETGNTGPASGKCSTSLASARCEGYKPNRRCHQAGAYDAEYPSDTPFACVKPLETEGICARIAVVEAIPGIPSRPAFRRF